MPAHSSAPPGRAGRGAYVNAHGDEHRQSTRRLPAWALDDDEVRARSEWARSVHGLDAAADQRAACERAEDRWTAAGLADALRRAHHLAPLAPALARRLRELTQAGW